MGNSSRDSRVSGGGWSIGSEVNQRHVAIFELLDTFTAGDGIRLQIKMRQAGTRWFSTIGRFRISVTDTRTPFLTEDVPRNIASVLIIPPSKRSEEEASRLLRYYCLRDKDWRQISNAIAQFQTQAPDEPQTMMAPVLEERQALRKTNILERGDFLSPLDEVNSGVPFGLPRMQSAEETPTRLDLAEWLTGPMAPLTARVFVNRVWQQYFGNSILAAESLPVKMTLDVKATSRVPRNYWITSPMSSFSLVGT